MSSTTEQAGNSPDPRSLLEGVDVSPLVAPHEPLKGLLTMSNRFVMAPMTRKFSPGNVPGDDVAEYYARRAASVGLLVTEGTYVDHESAGDSSRVPFAYGDAALAGWRGVTDAVHDRGGKIFAQLWHKGPARRPNTGLFPDAPVATPSGIGLTQQPVGEPLDTATIDAIIEGFARSGKGAMEAGFDGVEIHGAHGYLLDAFKWDSTNRRTDRYNGSIAARSRLGAEVVKAIRDVTGPNFPISYRFSQWKSLNYEAQNVRNGPELEQMLTPLVEAGVAFFHVSTRRFWLPGFTGSARTLAGWTKYVTGLPTIAVGSVGIASAFVGEDGSQSSLSLKPLMELFEQGEFDMVGVGRALLADPDWVSKLASGRTSDIHPYSRASADILH